MHGTGARTAPLPPYLAKIYKEKIGVDQLIKSGWNLSENKAFPHHEKYREKGF